MPAGGGGGGGESHYPESGRLEGTAALRYDVGVMGEARNGHAHWGRGGKGCQMS